MELFDSIKSTTVSLFREFLVSNRRNPDNRPPVTCIVADGIFSFAIDVANELGIPIISFRTISACAFWAYYCIPELVDNGELPFEEADMDLQVKSIPGMESFLRRRDLPNFCRANSISDPILQLVKIETRETRRSQGLILNTFEDLEGPILSEIRAHFAHVYAIGPLHTHLKSKLPLETTTYSSGNSLWQEDRSCMKWLDSKDFRSVLYVSFGSLTVITRNELIEFWHGLVNSEKHFLWVMRPDLITGKDGENQILTELTEKTKERGYMVDWAPQEDVLAHPAVGGFLTHSGWNSTLESVVAGVPMICWPYFADQQVNSRFVSEVWKIGIDMKDTCDRASIEKAVRDFMGSKREEFCRSSDRMSEMAKRSVSEGGSSYNCLNSLLQDIRLMSRRAFRG